MHEPDAARDALGSRDAAATTLALAWEDDAGAHRVALAPGARLVLGRDEACDVVLANLSVSRRHAELVVDDGGQVVLRHLSRTSPTWLGGRLVVGDAVLAAGDVLRLGIAELRIGPA